VLVGDTARVPLVAFAPLQPPPAWHEVALVEDQVTVEILPEVMLVGLAENATVGGGGPPLVNWASTAGEASTKGESAIVEASALTSRGLARRSEETKTKNMHTPIQAVAIRDCEATNTASEPRPVFLRC
jgi:hypothetical protein